VSIVLSDSFTHAQLVREEKDIVSFCTQLITIDVVADSHSHVNSRLTSVHNCENYDRRSGCRPAE